MSSKSKKRNLKWSDPWLGGIWRRLGVLLVAAGIGLVSVKYFSPWLICFFPEYLYGDIRTVVGAAPLTLPTFLVLWWFRTYDSITRGMRDNFEAGVAHIAKDIPISIEIGVGIIISVSEVTSSFDNEIRLTFMKRLKRPVADTQANNALTFSGYRYGYAQHIFRWMMARGGKWDLSNIKLQYQEFTGNEVTLEKILELSNFKNPTPKTFPINFDGCRFADKDHFFKGYDDYKKNPNPPTPEEEAEAAFYESMAAEAEAAEAEAAKTAEAEAAFYDSLATDDEAAEAAAAVFDEATKPRE